MKPRKLLGVEKESEQNFSKSNHDQEEQTTKFLWQRYI